VDKFYEKWSKTKGWLEDLMMLMLSSNILIIAVIDFI
jgi:hypothetical protein